MRGLDALTMTGGPKNGLISFAISDGQEISFQVRQVVLQTSKTPTLTKAKVARSENTVSVCCIITVSQVLRLHIPKEDLDQYPALVRPLVPSGNY